MKKRPLFWCGTILICFLSLMLQWDETIFYSAALAAENTFSANVQVEFSGRLKNLEKRENQTVLTVRDAQIIFENRSYKSNGLLVYCKDVPECSPGEKITGKGTLVKITKPENPGQFDARNYYNGKKIDYRIFSAEIIGQNGEKDYYLCFLEKVKTEFGNGLEKVFGKSDAGILRSMLLGDKGGMEDEVYAMYQLAGIAHIFAISGLHIGLVGRGIYGFLRKTGLKFGASFLISSGLIISYGIMTGSSPSAVRAVIMFCISVFARVCGRSYDLLTAIMTALVFVAIDNPYALQQSGVWLSFGAVLAIGTVYPCMEHFFQPKNGLWKSFLVSFSVHLFTLPLLAVSFFQFSVYGVILNLVVIPLMTFVFISGAIAGLGGMILPKAGMLFGGAAHYILMLYNGLCQLYLQIPGAVLVTGKPESWQVLLYYLLLFLGIWFMKRKWEIREKYGKCLKILFLLPLVLLVTVLLPVPKKGLRITMLDVGQGEGIFIQAREKNEINIFVDGGSVDVKEVGKYRILPYLKSNGITKIHKWLVTHGDSDHYSGLLEVMEEVKKDRFEIDSIALPQPANPGEGYEKICESAKETGIRVEYVAAGETWTCEKMTMRFLHPEKAFENETENSYSTVFLLEYGKFSGLFTGDVEGEGENCLQKLLGKEKAISLLKVAHHGSANSTTEEFCSVVNPRIALISAGADNSYGHPSEEVLNRLKEKKCEVFCTRYLGAVFVETDGKSINAGWQIEK